MIDNRENIVKTINIHVKELIQLGMSAGKSTSVILNSNPKQRITIQQLIN